MMTLKCFGIGYDLKWMALLVVVAFLLTSCGMVNEVQTQKSFVSVKPPYAVGLVVKNNGKCIFYYHTIENSRTRKYRGDWCMYGDTLLLQFKRFGLENNRRFRYLVNKDFSEISFPDGEKIFIEKTD